MSKPNTKPSSEGGKASDPAEPESPEVKLVNQEDLPEAPLEPASGAASAEAAEAVEQATVPAAEATPLDEKRLELLKDVTFQITVELGRKEIPFGEVLNLGRGSVIELNKLAEEPVDIYVNQIKVAEGEVVVVDEHFGVRISKLLSASER